MKILVIEDNVKHLKDAKKFFEVIDYVEVVYATTCHDAEDNFSGVSGIISDIFFPLCSLSEDARYSKPTEPIGISIAIQAEALKIPFVLNTDGYHHGPKLEWIIRLCRKKGWSMVDSGNPYSDAPHKDWDIAWEKLKYLIIKQK